VRSTKANSAVGTFVGTLQVFPYHSVLLGVSVGCSDWPHVYTFSRDFSGERGEC
jgi:hypothetical protein